MHVVIVYLLGVQVHAEVLDQPRIPAMEILSTLASKTQDQFMVNVIHIQVFLLKASSWLLIAPSLDVGETRSPLVVFPQASLILFGWHAPRSTASLPPSPK